MRAEIFDNGDFEYRYDLSRISDMDALTNVVIGAKFGTNELGDVSWLLDGTNTVTSIRLHRMSEFDWDGDGLANEIDPEQYIHNGDCHGQGEGWVLACLTNSAEIISAGGYTNWVAAVVENDTDGWWYSFTIKANAFDATGHAVVRIDDKAVVLDRENDSATFLLMRGRAYPFSADPSGATFSSSSHDGVQPQVEYALGTGLVSIMAGVEILPSGATLHQIPGYSTAYFEAREWNLNPALDFSRSWSSAFGRLQITPAGDGGFVFWGGSTNELSDILYCDTYFDGYTNRQSVVVRYDPDSEPLPHVSLSSPNTIFVNDDDDNHNGTNDYLDLSCSFSTPDDDIVPVVVEFKSLAHVTNGTLRLSALGLRIWENQNHNGTPVQSLTMTNCATPFERTLYVERDSLSHSQVDACLLALEWLECTDPALGCATNCITAVRPVSITNLYSRSAHLDGIDVYYVDKLVPRYIAGFSKRNGNKIIIGSNAVLSTLVHEIGHSFGMMDIYDYHGKKNGTSVVRLAVDGIVNADMFSPCDWNGGTGSCYYEFDRKSWVIQTFLMYGYRNETRMDIPLESVLGLIRDDSAPSGSRPSYAAIGFRGHQMHGVTQ